MNSAFLRYHLPAILWAVAIFVMSSIPSTALPNLGIFTSQDKLLHAGVFFVFAFLLYRSFTSQKRFPKLTRHPGIWTFMGATFYGVTDEIHQLYVTGRSGDYWDLAADAVGALAFLALIWAQGRLRRSIQHD